MRGYMRGAEIVGMMAAHIRNLGYSARAHTNVDSDVLHIPLILYAGLGELSRIGELVLNPFVGPRFKSAVITTDMPLAPDRMIDFGLQDMCNKCMKCARECPCDAIPWGDKVMFNGYEMWKPDAERCARYRVTNPKGAACGRCMKTCPYNHEGLLYHRFFLWLAMHVPAARKWIAILDDKVGNGRRNLVKKWWRDLEWLREGYAVEPKAGTNQRDLELDKQMDPSKQKIAYYHANMMPVPNIIEPQPVDRKAALAASALLETPAEAKARVAQGKPAPAHYTPTPPVERVVVKADV
jgi:ferredoxin